MKQFTGTMSHFANEQDYFEAKSKFYEEHLSEVKEELINIHHASWVATLDSGGNDNYSEVLFVYEQLDSLLKDEWTSPKNIESICYANG